MIRALAVSLATAAVLVAGCAWRDVDKGDYVAKNEAILNSVPAFPGGVLVATSSGESQRANGDVGRITGYETMQTFRVPTSAYRDQVKDFFKSRLLGEWALVGEGDEFVTFRRGSARLVIWPITARHVIELAVDHDAYQYEAAAG